MRRTAIVVSLVLAATLAQAHHGTAGQFDESKSINVSGVVTKMQFVNPHSYVYFEAKNATGGVDAWRCEMRASSVLKRSGWTADMFKAGTHITIAGVAARREPFGCYVNDVIFDDGKVIQRYQQLEKADKGIVTRTVKTADGKPNLAGNWAARQFLPSAQAVQRVASKGGIADPYAELPPPVVPYQQSEAGKAAAADYVREDNPRFHCLATNIVSDWTNDQPVNKIEQSTDTITLTYGFMDIVRTIHLNMATHPKNIKLGRAGHSIGKWEGDALVVDTVGFSPGYLYTGNGETAIRHSDKLHVTERFTLSKEGTSLVRTWVGDDALYLTAPFEGRDEVLASQLAYEPYACKDLTTEVAPGH